MLDEWIRNFKELPVLKALTKDGLQAPLVHFVISKSSAPKAASALSPQTAIRNINSSQC